jgi:hypothetical protein
MVLIMTSISGLAQTRPPIAPEDQEMVAKRAREIEKIENCQRQATEEKCSRAIVRNSSSAAWKNRQGIARYGYEPTREVAIAAFAKNWQRE